MKMILLIVILLFSSFQPIFCLLRPNSVYTSLIQDVYNYHGCNYITLYCVDINESMNVTKSTKLKDLQLYFTNQTIQTNLIMDIEDYIVKSGKHTNSKKSLFVVLDDSRGMKHQLEKLSASIGVTQFVWLVFISDTTDEFGLFANIYIPFNCQFMMARRNLTDGYSEIISEIYQVSRGQPKRHNFFAVWDSNNGTVFPTTRLYERRNNFYGLNLRITTIKVGNSDILVYDKDGKLKLANIYGPVLDFLQDQLNFTIRFFVKKPSNLFNWNEYLRPFDQQIWITLIAVIAITSIIITVIKLYYYHSDQNYAAALMKNRESLNVMDNVFTIFGAFCGQAMNRSLINSVYIVQFTVHLTATIIVAAYSAILISTLALDTFEPPFQSPEELVKDATYDIGLLKHSAYWALFQTADDNSMKRIYEAVVNKDTGVETTAEGYQKLCNSDKFGFLDSALQGPTFETNECRFAPSKSITALSLAMAFQKHSPYKDIFNGYLMAMRMKGVLNKLMADTERKNSKLEDQTWSAVDIIDISPLIYLLAINSCICVLVLWIEKIIYKRLMQRKIATISQRLITNLKYPKPEEKNSENEKVVEKNDLSQKD